MVAKTLNSVNFKNQEGAAPWWKFGYVWMIIAGPAIVVVAGFVTLWIAMSDPDAIVDENYYQRGLELSQPSQNQAADMVPAVKGRNHVVTPQEDKPE